MRVPSGFLAALLALLIAGSAALPAAAGTSVGVTVSTNDPQAMAGVLMLGAMAAFFGAQQGSSAPAPAPAPVQAPAPQTGVSVTIHTGPAPAPRPQRDPWSDLPAWYVASYADVPVERIVELRRTGHHWSEIVERYRLPQEFRGRTVIVTENPAGKHKVKVKKSRPVVVAYTDDEFERFVFVRFLEDYYAVPRTTVTVWLSRGLSLHDIYLSVNLATRVHVQPDVIVRYRLAGEPWEVICRRHRVSLSELSQPVILQRHSARKVRLK